LIIILRTSHHRERCLGWAGFLSVEVRDEGRKLYRKVEEITLLDAWLHHGVVVEHVLKSLLEGFLRITFLEKLVNYYYTEPKQNQLVLGEEKQEFMTNKIGEDLLTQK
jgi:hypothetical protein